MVNEEKIKKIYEAVIAEIVLTTKELNSYGFNSKDINELIEKGIIRRIKRGYYSFYDVENLFYYGKKLIAEKEYEKATQCFEVCVKKDVNHPGANFQLFIRSINKKDYSKAFEYFEIISNTDNPFYANDSNFYLYLLSIITDIPEHHREYARFLKIEDIRVDFKDKRYADIPQQNKIRISVLQRKFPYALKQLKDLTAKHGKVTLQDIITRTLLFQAFEVENLSKAKIVNLIKEKNYEEVVEYLNKKQERHNLSLSERYILMLAKVFINIEETKQIPEKKFFQTENLFDAIDGNNFNLALELSEKYNTLNGIKGEENAINMLLSDICDLIKSLTANKVDNSVVAEESDDIENLDMSSEVRVQEKVNFSDILGYLVLNDLKNAFMVLRKYLDSINKRDYEFLIVDLIKLSLVEKDGAFTKPMISLTYVSRDNFKFDISNYIQEFYVALSERRFASARIYLDIISNANKLGEVSILTDGLYEVLNSSEKVKSNIPSEDIIIGSQLDDAISDSAETVKPVVVPVSNSKQRVPSIEVPIETRDSEKEFIEAKRELLLNGQGIILLRPMDNERRKRIHMMVKKYPDMVSFSIGEGKDRQIVLRYKPEQEGYVDIKRLIEIGNKAYQDKNYDGCIEAYLQLLQFGEPKAFVYAKLGLAYMKKWNKELAVDYLTIATQMSKKENGQYDFTELIASLKGMIKEEDKKPRFRMKTEDFQSDIDNSYGIEDVGKITEFICASGLDVESAGHELGLTDEQIDILRLIYAREYYFQGNYEKGDQFLKSVEQSKNKTKFVIKLIDEVRRNKKFYIHRQNENPQGLVLSLQPRKSSK